MSCSLLVLITHRGLHQSSNQQHVHVLSEAVAKILFCGVSSTLLLPPCSTADHAHEQSVSSVSLTLHRPAFTSLLDCRARSATQMTMLRNLAAGAAHQLARATQICKPTHAVPFASVARNAGSQTSGTVGASTNYSGKPRVVVLGTGWSSFAFAKNLKREAFDVTIVSPRNHMLFTPLLASTAVGTLEFRSISQPVKNSMRDVHFVKGEATKLDTTTKTVVAETSTLTSKGEHISQRVQVTIPYDVLVIGVGARNNTFNIVGVEENLFFLKELGEARSIRQRIIQNVEMATFGGVSQAERRRLLSFVIIGGGPTGVEFSAELHDFVLEVSSSEFLWKFRTSKREG